MPRTKDPSKWLTRDCPRCGKTFDTPQSWPRTYCSNDCYRGEMAERHAETTCPECGKVFSYHVSWPRKFCSRNCRAAAIGRETSKAYTATCESCGKQFQAKPSHTRGRFCSSRCYGKWLSDTGVQSGPNSPVWRGGGEYRYYGANWTYVRRLVRERDCVCQDCGITPEQFGGALDVHHIDPFRNYGISRYREANRLDNLVLLCTPCHLKREYANAAGG